MIGSVSGPVSTLVNDPINQNQGVVNVSPLTDPEKPRIIENAGETTKKSPGHKSSPAECETCKNRKYVDGSDEMVSFKSPTHISPNASGAKVRAHEQEHVTNAYSKASQKNGKVVNCFVSLHTAVCPECGRTYVSGGTTHTSIKYYGDNNAYHKAADAAADQKYNGKNVDTTV